MKESDDVVLRDEITALMYTNAACILFGVKNIDAMNFQSISTHMC